MKIVFKRKENGNISADNPDVFNSKCITEELYNKICESVEATPDLTIFNSKFVDYIMYAVVPESHTYKVKKVYAVKSSDNIKLMFESTTSRFGSRAYIEDGDILYTDIKEISSLIK